ncbi:MAG: ASKHA domain-containing protein [Lachnospiraceae bacterium]|nr:ASKHA domain-containing protein [Lachnospiraceae bacterium]
MKRIQRVSINDKFIVECRESESIYQVLADSGFTFLGNCGGKGICGKCVVTVGTQKVLACQYKIQNDISVSTGNLWQYTGNNTIASEKPDKTEKADTVSSSAPNIAVAVDLGSTTIGVSCMDLEKKCEITAFSFTNPQYSYGADVISRIRFCMEKEENLLLLGQLVENMLQKTLKERLGEAYSNIGSIVYSGNTTMLHILRGLSVDGLSKAPFMPVSTEYEVCKRDMVNNIFPPGFSAFVGADILTGAEFLKMGRNEAYDLLIDLGTNGEMLLLNKDCGCAAATACGPVFDSAVTGAVYGSECIKAIANCIKRRLVDRTGRIASHYFDKGIEIDKGFIIRQENIRNFQLAKGAVYAGIQCLLRECGITADCVANVYISGGLGFYMDIRDAFTVKLLPEEFREKITISGNTSLEGARKLVLSDDRECEVIVSEYQAIKERTTSLELADLDGFQDAYMQSLDF